jgi:hypothetical protein
MQIGSRANGGNRRMLGWKRAKWANEKAETGGCWPANENNGPVRKRKQEDIGP